MQFQDLRNIGSTSILNRLILINDSSNLTELENRNETITRTVDLMQNLQQHDEYEIILNEGERISFIYMTFNRESIPYLMARNPGFELRCNETRYDHSDFQSSLFLAFNSSDNNREFSCLSGFSKIPVMFGFTQYGVPHWHTQINGAIRLVFTMSNYYFGDMQNHNLSFKVAISTVDQNEDFPETVSPILTKLHRNMITNHPYLVQSFLVILDKNIPVDEIRLRVPGFQANLFMYKTKLKLPVKSTKKGYLITFDATKTKISDFASDTNHDMYGPVLTGSTINIIPGVEFDDSKINFYILQKNAIVQGDGRYVFKYSA